MLCTSLLRRIAPHFSLFKSLLCGLTPNRDSKTSPYSFSNGGDGNVISMTSSLGSILINISLTANSAEIVAYIH